VDVSTRGGVGGSILLPYRLEVELGIGTGSDSGLSVVGGSALDISIHVSNSFKKEGIYSNSVDVRSVGLCGSLGVGLCGFVGRHLVQSVVG
jgi:hypothetical protein